MFIFVVVSCCANALTQFADKHFRRSRWMKKEKKEKLKTIRKMFTRWKIHMHWKAKRKRWARKKRKLNLSLPDNPQMMPARREIWLCAEREKAAFHIIHGQSFRLFRSHKNQINKNNLCLDLRWIFKYQKHKWKARGGKRSSKKWAAIEGTFRELCQRWLVNFVKHDCWCFKVLLLRFVVQNISNKVDEIELFMTILSFPSFSCQNKHVTHEHFPKAKAQHSWNKKLSVSKLGEGKKVY